MSWILQLLYVRSLVIPHPILRIKKLGMKETDHNVKQSNNGLCYQNHSGFVSDF
jgi:hypothetical protein